MRVTFGRSTDRRTPPGLDETYHVTVQMFNRPQRDTAVYLMMSGGDAAGLTDHLLSCGVADFCLPSDEGDVRMGDGRDHHEVYRSLDPELTDWVLEAILDHNRLLPESLKRTTDTLGNSERPSGSS